MKRTLYDVLGIPNNAGPEEILLAYKLRSAGPAFEQLPSDERLLLKEAFSVLSNPAKREQYDASLDRQAEVVRYDSDPHEGSGSRWPLWLAAALVVAGIAYSCQSGKKSSSPAPVVVDRVVILNGQPTTPGTPVASPTPSPASARSSEELFSLLSPSTAMVLATNKGSGRYVQGSGVVIDRGTLITNCHVTNDATEIEVHIGGQTHAARVEVADNQFDLCRLSVAGLDAPAVKIGSVSEVRTGQKVLALGAPKGFELTISEGIVSSLRNEEEGTIIQTTAPISNGSSGGGLFTTSGELIGIITLTHKYGQNLNFAFPADWIGQMQNREATGDRPHPEPAEGPKATARDGSKDSLIVGRWHCFRPDLGKHVDLEFFPDGSLGGTWLGRPLGGRYSVGGKTLTLFWDKSYQLNIEELVADHMVLTDIHLHVACDRLR